MRSPIIIISVHSFENWKKQTEKKQLISITCRDCTFAFGTWAVVHRNTILWQWWVQQVKPTSLAIWKSTPNMNFSLRHSIEVSKVSRAIRKSFKHSKMVSWPEFASLYRRCQHHRNLYTRFPVPSSPPDNVQTGMLNLTAGWVRWSPPPPQHHNGLLLGYKIQVQFIIIVCVWPFAHHSFALEIHLSILFIGFGCGSEAKNASPHFGM